MLVYILKRIVYIFCILAVMSVLIFAITQALPGNVARMILGEFATVDQIQAIEEKLRLNDPLPLQYWRWVSALLTGDLGDSLVMERPVAPLISLSLQRSAILAFMSLFCVASIGITLGVIAAVKHNRAPDYGISFFSYLGISVPEFFWGILIILFFARYLGWIPATGYVPLSEGFGTWLSHLIAPVATLTLTLLANISRMTRSSMLEELGTNYVTAARAKGLPERVVLFRHALRNALLPTITVLAVGVGWLFGGIVVVETVFAYPGMGRMLLFAIEHRDLPLIQAGILIITAIYSLSNLSADLLYAYLNPRIRYGRTIA
ncbi:ABC transporter permease [Ruegeria sp. HKCCD8929]|uniref:ABC transporter permease n=1 Tax=Ruegeria sp. HKCCD8929 TaxID=2683006 RepID=UPI001487D7CB|nr:ABC transporter permease [Ruegeria sp. HKCCD8929]